MGSVPRTKLNCYIRTGARYVTENIIFTHGITLGHGFKINNVVLVLVLWVIVYCSTKELIIVTLSYLHVPIFYHGVWVERGANFTMTHVKICEEIRYHLSWYHFIANFNLDILSFTKFQVGAVIPKEIMKFYQRQIQHIVN